jgi:hypothetical protein
MKRNRLAGFADKGLPADWFATMTFTIARQTLIRMVRYVARKSPSRKRRDKLVSVSASGPWVFLQGNGRAAGAEALVLEEGTARLVPSTLLMWLKRRAGKANVTFEADMCVFRMDGGNWPIARFSGKAMPPGTFKRFSSGESPRASKYQWRKK